MIFNAGGGEKTKDRSSLRKDSIGNTKKQIHNRWRQMTRAVAETANRKKSNKTKKEAKPVNKDQFRGNWRQFKGEVKKTWGQLTDNDLLEIEGNYDKFLGVVQKKYGDRKGEIERWTEQWCERQAADARKAAEPRS